MADDDRKALVNELSSRIVQELMRAGVFEAAQTKGGDNCSLDYRCDATSFACGREFRCDASFTCSNKFTG